MTINKRYNRDEIGRILKRAAELDHENNSSEEHLGLTLQELQEVSKEVGINPKYVEQALEEFKSSKTSLLTRIIGGPFSYNKSEIAEYLVDEEKWEDIVADIRKIHGGIGKTSKLGSTFEWEQRKQEVGYIQISCSPKIDHTKIFINANYSYYAIVIYLLTATLSLSVLGILLKNLELPILSEVIIGSFASIGLFTLARYYLSSWIKKKRSIYQKLINRIKSLPGMRSEKEQKNNSQIFIDQETSAEDNNQLNRSHSPALKHKS